MRKYGILLQMGYDSTGGGVGMKSLRLLAVVVLLSLVVVAAWAGQPSVVDEPLGARYSLGMTLWHLGHSAEMIVRFHEYLKQSKLTPDKLLPAAKLKPPSKMVSILIEPELLTKEQLGGWSVNGESITSGAGDNGPTATIPLIVPRAGLYRLWVQYHARPGCRGVTFIKIYRTGLERLGPICQYEEFYDQPAEEDGPAWKDMLVDLPAGSLSIKMGHVVRWWQGGGGYDTRSVDCFYLTDEIWADPPAADVRKAVEATTKPVGAQWTSLAPLPATDAASWKWWQVRPLSWEDRLANPRLFALSHKFQKGIVDELSLKEYQETTPPDYRVPERQVVFNETWNMVANPVRARRQIDVLNADVCRKPLGYNYVWHDVGGNIEGLRADGAYDPKGPYAKYGGWYGSPGGLSASWGNPVGTVATYVPVEAPGKYSVWVLSNAINLSYAAPWFGKAYVDGKEQFTYHHNNCTSLWMKMGEVTVDKPGNVKVEFTLDGSGFGGTYRNIFTLFLMDDPKIVPVGTVRPPWTMDMYRKKAAQSGASKTDKLLVWLSDNPYSRLSQEVWGATAWPAKPVRGLVAPKTMLVPREACKAVQVGLRNLTDNPISLTVTPGPLKGKAGSFQNAVTWRVEGFIPYGSGRQEWTPFFLLRRPDITVPPLNLAGIWLTVNTKGVPAGDYVANVKLRGKGVPEYTMALNVRVSRVAPSPKQPVLVDGYTGSHEGEVYLRDFVEHGMNVWPGEMSKEDMRKWGIRMLRLNWSGTEGADKWVAHLKSLGLDYSDYFVAIADEPGGTTEEQLKPYLDAAKALRAADPKVRISFNPSESAELATFQVLAPYCDFWCPYSKHVYGPYWGNPEKQAIFRSKPWIWYTTPCLWDKTTGDPGIRQVPSQLGNCVGVAFFALNYPWRDQWDTAYEHLLDASTMGAVQSRHGPVTSLIWEQIRECVQTANLAMMVREKLGVKTYDEVKDPKLQKLISEGTEEELVRWLEGRRLATRSTLGAWRNR